MEDRRFGGAIRALRSRKRWRQIDLADRAGVSATTIGRIERGRLEGIALGRLRCVADALDERGIIDVLAWHPGRRALLVIELKTEIVDVSRLLGSMDQRRRLAWRIARERGWDPITVSTWVVLALSRSNQRALATHAAVLRRKFPIDGRGVRRWLRDPLDRIDALSFLPNHRQVALGHRPTPTRRVLPRR